MYFIDIFLRYTLSGEVFRHTMIVLHVAVSKKCYRISESVVLNITNPIFINSVDEFIPIFRYCLPGS
ncbi:hypothetical protein DVK07_21520 [Halorubrum sp. Atlit-26R]|nr:hypothetical protein DVK07_21520 [Halorubrum sp. Atlit-26R]